MGIWLCGGATLAGQLVDEIDELVIKRYPVVLGSGVALFRSPFTVTSFALHRQRRCSTPAPRSPPMSSAEEMPMLFRAITRADLTRSPASPSTTRSARSTPTATWTSWARGCTAPSGPGSPSTTSGWWAAPCGGGRRPARTPSPWTACTWRRRSPTVRPSGRPAHRGAAGLRRPGRAEAAAVQPDAAQRLARRAVCLGGGGLAADRRAGAPGSARRWSGCGWSGRRRSVCPFPRQARLHRGIRRGVPGRVPADRGGRPGTAKPAGTWRSRARRPPPGRKWTST